MIGSAAPCYLNVVEEKPSLFRGISVRPLGLTCSGVEAGRHAMKLP
jgi:hypothetical protein